MLGGHDGPLDVSSSPYEETLRVTSGAMNSPFQFARSLNFADGVVDNEYFKVRNDLQGTSIGKDILLGQAALYESTGLLDKMRINANLDVGGYAWAKYGYVPTESSWESLSSRIRAQSNYITPIADGADIAQMALSPDPKTVWAISDSPHGKQLLIGTSWDGELSFRDEESMRRFRMYLGGNR